MQRHDAIVSAAPKPLLALVPGIQGRWEWMTPAVAALGKSFSVRTFSLNEAWPVAASEAPHSFFTQWHTCLQSLLEDAPRPVPLVGVSFGGLVALTYAAAYPTKVSHLILVSTPSPDFVLDANQTGYLERPTLSAPLFAGRAVGRLAPEVSAALPSWYERARFVAVYAARALRYPSSPRLMAGWVREWQRLNVREACGLVRAPTLIVTGDPHLDRIVPVTDTLRYLALIDGAQRATLPFTGHLGFLLKPTHFADLVATFVAAPDGVARPGPATARS